MKESGSDKRRTLCRRLRRSTPETDIVPKSARHLSITVERPKVARACSALCTAPHEPVGAPTCDVCSASVLRHEDAVLAMGDLVLSPFLLAVSAQKSIAPRAWLLSQPKAPQVPPGSPCACRTAGPCSLASPGSSRVHSSIHVRYHETIVGRSLRGRGGGPILPA